MLRSQIALSEKEFKASYDFLMLGIVLFSGSIFMLSTQQLHGWPVKYLGPITPVGGLLLISAWGYLMLSFLRK